VIYVYPQDEDPFSTIPHWQVATAAAEVGGEPTMSMGENPCIRGPAP